MPQRRKSRPRNLGRPIKEATADVIREALKSKSFSSQKHIGKRGMRQHSDAPGQNASKLIKYHHLTTKLEAERLQDGEKGSRSITDVTRAALREMMQKHTPEDGLLQQAKHHPYHNAYQLVQGQVMPPGAAAVHASLVLPHLIGSGVIPTPPQPPPVSTVLRQMPSIYGDRQFCPQADGSRINHADI